MLYELEATVTESEFRSFAKKLNLQPYNPEQDSKITNLPHPAGDQIVYVGNCTGMLLEWALFENGRMRYWDSVGY